MTNSTWEKLFRSISSVYTESRGPFLDLLGNLVGRLGNYVLFPFIVSHSQMPRADLREQLAPLRARFLLLAALGFSLFVATADLAIRIFYDQRYQAASWMLPVLTVGSWFSILANVSESTLLGLGKPSYGAVSNGLKFIFLLIGLPLGVEVFGTRWRCRRHHAG